MVSEGAVCPHCRAVQGAHADPRCWLCRLPLESPAQVPPPPRPLPADGVEGRATEAALVAGMVSVGAGALLISGGFGLSATLVVVLPCAWVLGDMVLSRPASRSAPPLKRGPLHPRPKPPARPESAWDKAAKVFGTILLIVSLGSLTFGFAVFFCCAALLGGPDFMSGLLQWLEVIVLFAAMVGLGAYFLSR